MCDTADILAIRVTEIKILISGWSKREYSSHTSMRVAYFNVFTRFSRGATQYFTRNERSHMEFPRVAC